MDKRSPPPPPQEEKKGVTANLIVSPVVTVLAIIPALFALFFHLGAAYLSYKKYASIGWAIVDFFFAVFYYPYYAFFLAGDSNPTAPLMGPALQTAGKRRVRK